MKTAQFLYIVVIAENVVPEGEIPPGDTGEQLSLFSDPDSDEKERMITYAMSLIRTKYGPNAVLKGINYLDGATTRERNTQIGGHRA